VTDHTEAWMQTSYERQDHRGRHRYRSHLCARQHGRDHRVSVGRFRGRIVHRAAAPAPPRTARRRVTYSSINRALTMWCDHPSTKAITFLIDHVNRASRLRQLLTERCRSSRPWRQAVVSMIPPAFWLALKRAFLGKVARLDGAVWGAAPVALHQTQAR
jgi:hypothetical protein